MLVYGNRDEKGNLISFDLEVDFSRKTAVRIIESIPGVTVLTISKEPFWLRDEVFCKFKINDMDFEIWEPFGDNSRFSIMSDNSNPNDMEILYTYLLKYIHKPAPILSLLSLSVMIVMLIVISSLFNQ